MVTTAPKKQRHAVARSVVVYEPNYKARYTVTKGA